MEDDKSATNFHKLILLNLLILCEPKQNKWGKWGLEVEEVAEEPPEDDDDGGDDGDDGGVCGRFCVGWPGVRLSGSESPICLNVPRMVSPSSVPSYDIPAFGTEI